MRLLLSILLFTSIAEAQKLQVIPLRLIVIENQDTSVNDQINLFIEGVSRFNETNTYIDIKDIKVFKDVLHLNDYKYYINRLYKWHEWAIKNKVTTNRILTHFLLPPVVLNGTNYIGGVAGAICANSRRNSKRQFSYSIARLQNDIRQDRREQSRVAAMHEILHVLGSQHIDRTPNMMHPAALNFVVNFKTYLLHPATKDDVNRCRHNKKLLQRRSFAGKDLFFR